MIHSNPHAFVYTMHFNMTSWITEHTGAEAKYTSGIVLVSFIRMPMLISGRLERTEINLMHFISEVT